MTDLTKFKRGFVHDPKQWGKTATQLNMIAEHMKAMGAAALVARNSVADVVVANMRAQRQEKLHQEAAAALGRGDHKKHRQLIVQLRALQKDKL